MTDPKLAPHKRPVWDDENRFVMNDLTGITIDRSQEEGEPFDMSPLTDEELAERDALYAAEEAAEAAKRKP